MNALVQSLFDNSSLDEDEEIDLVMLLYADMMAEAEVGRFSAWSSCAPSEQASWAQQATG